MVYVISKNGKPLMPCENVVARLLLKNGKAKVKRKEPFTIKLLYDTTEYTQPLTLGVDTGSGTAGFAVSDNNGNIVYISEVVVRNDIKKKMDKRRSYRRNRRSRKTRYRKPRFDNRKSSKHEGRLTPTVKSKLDSHDKEINYIKSILPITNKVYEVGHFDPRALREPWVRNENMIHWAYQKGLNYGYENTRMMVLARDNYTCQICGKKDGTKEVHHKIYRNQGGSDEPDNLMTVCPKCHAEIHAGKVVSKQKGRIKGTLLYATQMDVIRSQLLKRHPDAIMTYGYVTSANRKALGFDKSTHWFDASIIATAGNMPVFRTNIVYKKKCVPEGNFAKTRGLHSEQRLPDGKIMGFKKFDKVKYLGNEYFIKGRMSNGEAVLMNITGEKVSFFDMPKGMKTPKLRYMKRLTAQTSWIVDTERISDYTKAI